MCRLPRRNSDLSSKLTFQREECQKNHTASWYTVDGCCDFKPAGEDGCAAALRCAACNCHQKFVLCGL
ncbi:hypothetical protein ACS0TY_018514 [Phlomoides rotata]